MINTAEVKLPEIINIYIGNIHFNKVGIIINKKTNNYQVLEVSKYRYLSMAEQIHKVGR